MRIRWTCPEDMPHVFGIKVVGADGSPRCFVQRDTLVHQPQDISKNSKQGPCGRFSQFYSLFAALS
ncbi:unnamed protein product [Ixodes persulcatus]